MKCQADQREGLVMRYLCFFFFPAVSPSFFAETWCLCIYKSGSIFSIRFLSKNTPFLNQSDKVQASKTHDLQSQWLSISPVGSQNRMMSISPCSWVLCATKMWSTSWDWSYLRWNKSWWRTVVKSCFFLGRWDIYSPWKLTWLDKQEFVDVSPVKMVIFHCHGSFPVCSWRFFWNMLSWTAINRGKWDFILMFEIEFAFPS